MITQDTTAAPQAEQPGTPVGQIVAPFPGMDKPWPEAEKQRLCEVFGKIFGAPQVDQPGTPVYAARLIEALYENGDPVSVDAAEEMQRVNATRAGALAVPSELSDDQIDAILTDCGWTSSQRHDVERQRQIRESFRRTLNSAYQCNKPAYPSVVDAARAVVAMTLAEARAADDAGESLLYCRADVLNPCWDGAWSKEHGPGKHWGGGEACAECMLRAALAAAPAAALSAQGAPSDAMVDAYLLAQRKAVEEADRFGRPNVGGLHTNTVREACRAGIAAALAAAPAVELAPGVPGSPWQASLEIRMAQGWKLKGDRLPVLYTDAINGEQVCRDDLWLCTAAALAAPAAQGDALDAALGSASVALNTCKTSGCLDVDGDFCEVQSFDRDAVAAAKTAIGAAMAAKDGGKAA